MGHLRRRTTKNGKTSWQIIIETDRDPITGRRQRRYFTVNGTKKEADATMNKLEYEMICGHSVIKPSSQKLCDWLKEWMDKYNYNLSPTTKTGYRQQIRTRINKYIGNAPINTLSTGQIQNWVNTLTSNGLSGKTIKNTFLNVKAALDALSLAVFTRTSWVILFPQFTGGNGNTRCQRLHSWDVMEQESGSSSLIPKLS